MSVYIVDLYMLCVSLNMLVYFFCTCCYISCVYMLHVYVGDLYTLVSSAHVFKKVLL